MRVLLELATFPVGSAEELYEGARTVDWSLWLTERTTLAVEATGLAGMMPPFFRTSQVRANRGSRSRPWAMAAPTMMSRPPTGWFHVMCSLRTTAPETTATRVMT